MCLLPISRIYIPLALLAGLLLFPSCDKESSDPDTPTTYKLTLTESTRGKITQDPDQTTFKSGAEVSLTPVPNEGYEFTGWMENDVPKGKEKDNPLKLTMDSDKMIAATFAKAYYTLTLTTPENGTVTQSPDKAKYEHGETVTLTAKPASDYAFDGWTGDVPSGKEQTNPLTLTMDAAKTIGATFAKKTYYTLTLTTPTNGTVTQSPDKAKYEQSETVTLTAKPATDYDFTGWTGDVPSGKENTNPLTLTMDAAKTIGATFAKKVYHTLTLILTTPEKGTLAKSPDQAKYAQGETVTLTATAKEGYEFTGWKLDVPSGKENTNPLTVTMDSAKKIAATFGDLPIYLATNGKTLKAADFTKGGEKYTYKGKEYTIAADKAALVAARDANKDMSKYITSKVTDMSELFKDKSTFNQDISAWDVGSVTTMEAMFSEATAFNQDLGSWDVSKVTNMEAMFFVAAAFNQYIGNWDVSSVTNMLGMFFQAKAFDQNIGGWQVGKVTNMNSMFQEAAAFDQNIGDWDVSAVTDMRGMFAKTVRFNQDLSRWCVEKIKSKPDLFDDAAPEWFKTGRQPVWGDASKCTK